MSEQSISLKSVYELRVDAADQPIRYRIPHYQRGFAGSRGRWNSYSKIFGSLPGGKALSGKTSTVRNPSCSGRQRKTADPGGRRTATADDPATRSSPLQCGLAERYQQKLYSLEYETRPSLSDFLANPTEQLAASNIDFFHLDQAIKTIERWFRRARS